MRTKMQKSKGRELSDLELGMVSGGLSFTFGNVSGIGEDGPLAPVIRAVVLGAAIGSAMSAMSAAGGSIKS